MRNNILKFEKNSLAGPVDRKALELLQARYSLDESYLRLIRKFHGGIPEQQYIAGKGRSYRVGRFLTVLDTHSNLPGQFQPHFDRTDTDCRIVRSILFAIDGECATSRALYYGERLVPFAAFFAGEHHPDQMCLDRGYVSLLCFDYGTGARPAVVVWHAQDAIKEYQKWEVAGCPFKPTKVADVDYTKFTEPIAENFDEFMNLMRSKPSPT